RFEDYESDHLTHHSRKIFTTINDPDAAFLVDLGFEPGQPFEELWARLLRTPFSPRFHAIFLRARLKTNFVDADPVRKALAAVTVIALAVAAKKMGPARAVTLIALPHGPLYHISALLQFASEHAWLKTAESPSGREEYQSRTWGRASIVPLPKAGLPWPARGKAWSRWGAGTVVQQSVRWGVLVGDLPAHDYHHLVQHDHDWQRAIWNRQLHIDSGDKLLFSQREYATIQEVLTEVLTLMSKSEPLRAAQRNITS
ncbi:MAG: hypothetical protein ACRCYU_20300, partial [Nocardioides sp.]